MPLSHPLRASPGFLGKWLRLWRRPIAPEPEDAGVTRAPLTPASSPLLTSDDIRRGRTSTAGSAKLLTIGFNGLAAVIASPAFAQAIAETPNPPLYATIPATPPP
jgi:hypothetical protein